MTRGTYLLLFVGFAAVLVASVMFRIRVGIAGMKYVVTIVAILLIFGWLGHRLRRK